MPRLEFDTEKNISIELDKMELNFAMKRERIFLKYSQATISKSKTPSSPMTLFPLITARNMRHQAYTIS